MTKTPFPFYDRIKEYLPEPDETAIIVGEFPHERSISMKIKGTIFITYQTDPIREVQVSLCRNFNDPETGHPCTRRESFYLNDEEASNNMPLEEYTVVIDRNLDSPDRRPTRYVHYSTADKPRDTTGDSFETVWAVTKNHKQYSSNRKLETAEDYLVKLLEGLEHSIERER